MKRLFTTRPWRTRHVWDMFVVVTILIVPFFIYTHLLFDKETSATAVFFGFELTHGFSNMQTFIWYLLTKLIPIILCLLWFFTCIQNWRYFILLPISLYGFSFLDTLLFILLKNELHSYLATSVVLIGILIFIYTLDKIFEASRNFLIQKVSYKIQKTKDLYLSVLYQLKLTKDNKSYIDRKEYSARLYYIRDIIIERFNIKYLLSDPIEFTTFPHEFKPATILLLLFPIIYFSYVLIPSGITSFEVLGFELGNNGFKDVSTFYWFLLSKLSVLLLLVIWFISTCSWWRYGLLSPIILYTYQFIEALQDVHHLDSYGNLKVFPALVAIILLIIGLGNVVRYKYGILDAYQRIENELETLIELAAKVELNEISQMRKYKVNRSAQSRNDEIEDVDYLEILYRLEKQIKYKLKMNS